MHNIVLHAYHYPSTLKHPKPATLRQRLHYSSEKCWSYKDHRYRAPTEHKEKCSSLTMVAKRSP